MMLHLWRRKESGKTEQRAGKLCAIGADTHRSDRRRSHSPPRTVIPDRTINRLSFRRADIPNDADSRYSSVGKARLLILGLERLERAARE